MRNVKLIAIGCSSGGVEALQKIFSKLPKLPVVPIVVVLHIHPQSVINLDLVFSRFCHSKIVEAEDKTTLEPGHIYFAPPSYHLLVESDYSLSLSQEEPVNFSRPSIDVLFESTALALKSEACGILLTGSNSDGAVGLFKIKDYLGYTIVQSPESADSPVMPQSAIDLFKPDFVGNLEQIGDLIAQTAGADR